LKGSREPTHRADSRASHAALEVGDDLTQDAADKMQPMETHRARDRWIAFALGSLLTLVILRAAF
jgi:hypothetical protein